MSKTNDNESDVRVGEEPTITLPAEEQAAKTRARKEPTFDHLCGTIIAERIKISELIGSGGMSSVYKGFDSQLKRSVAVKVLLPELAASDRNILRFKQEARAAARLDHPNIVKVLEFDVTQGGLAYLVMDYVDGRSLSDVLREQRMLDIQSSVDITLEACKALKHAHSHQVVHRDLKPSNMMLSEDEYSKRTLKLVDFGIAKILSQEVETSQNLTQTGEVFGSPLYMSPEQGIGNRADHRTDIYSLGCVIYECLTGLPPFCGETALQTLMMHQSSPVLSLKEATIGLDFPEELERIVQKMLAKRPQDRYQTVDDLLTDLGDFLNGRIDLSKFIHIHTFEGPQQGRQDLSEFFRLANQSNLQRIEMKQLASQEKSKPQFESWIFTSTVIVGCIFCVLFFIVVVPRSFPHLDEKKEPVQTQGNEEFQHRFSDIHSDMARAKARSEEREFRERLMSVDSADFKGMQRPSKDWNKLQGLKGISEFVFSESSIDNNGLKLVSDLPISKLDVSNCKNISSNGLLVISKLKDLISLSLTGVCVTKDVMQALPRKLTFLSLDDTQLNESSLNSMPKLPALLVIDISRNPNIANGIRIFGQLPNLRKLIISAEQIPDAATPRIVAFKLPMLVVKSNQIDTRVTLSHEKIRTLTLLKQVGVLDLSNVYLSTNDILYLRAALPNTYVQTATTDF